MLIYGCPDCHGQLLAGMHCPMHGTKGGWVSHNAPGLSVRDSSDRDDMLTWLKQELGKTEGREAMDDHWYPLCEWWKKK